MTQDPSILGRRLHRLFLLAALGPLTFAAACSGADSPTGAGGAMGGVSPGSPSSSGSEASSSGGGTSTSGDATSSGDAASSGTGTGGSGPAHIAACVATCVTPLDCGIPNSPAYTSSHYACTAGRCEYKGCTSTAECNGQSPNSNYVCKQIPGHPVKRCYPACSAAAECASPNAPLYDAAHYACTDGLCEWKGCASTTECKAQFLIGNYVCNDTPGASFKSCYPGCSAAWECATPDTPLYDVAHYACTAGLCEWKGCTSTAECKAQFPDDNTVCE